MTAKEEAMTKPDGSRTIREWIGPIATILALLVGGVTFVYSYDQTIHDNTKNIEQCQEVIPKLVKSNNDIRIELKGISVEQKNLSKQFDKLEFKIEKVLLNFLQII